MSTDQIRFDDGAAYERYMGHWSQLVGDAFLNWLSPKPGLRWLDVGCGNGAFTQMIVDCCAPAAVEGIDPSEGQLSFARTRFSSNLAKFQLGDAMALPFPDASFDAIVMPLVIFFVPEPVKGVAEMARVVRHGGLVTAYAWDMPGGGFPYESLREELAAIGFPAPMPPSPDASRLEVLHELWTGAGLESIETCTISVERTFVNFDDYWTTIQGGPSVGGKLAAMSASTRDRLISNLRVRLPKDEAGRITYSARANAIKGYLPA